MKRNEPKQAGRPAAPATVAPSERAVTDANREADAFLDADAWIEHLEEEIEPKCSMESKSDMELLLKNSAEDAALLASLREVRAAVATLKDDVALPEDGAYYDQLHSKIMAAIDNEITLGGEPGRTASSAATKKTRRPVLLSSMFGAFGLTMMVAVLAFIGLQSRTPSAVSSMKTPLAQADSARETLVEENFERKIAMVDSHSGALFARDMGSFESEEDFLTETAAARLKQVSSKQAEAMLRSLRR